MIDSLGDRMKIYEKCAQNFLTPRTPVVIRVDGKAFHSFTKSFRRPFDKDFMEVMVMAAQKTASQIQGFKLGYVQSDEASFVITDYDDLNTQGWFRYRHDKIVSISASLMTAHFNEGSRDWEKIAYFDSRAFNVPKEDVANYFLWRAKDWKRNSISMLSQSHFSHKQLHGKSQQEMILMLSEKGIIWDKLRDQEKYGTFIARDCSLHTSVIAEYPIISELITSQGV